MGTVCFATPRGFRITPLGRGGDPCRSGDSRNAQERPARNLRARLRRLVELRERRTSGPAEPPACRLDAAMSWHPHPLDTPHRVRAVDATARDAAGGRLVAALNVDVGHAGAQILWTQGVHRVRRTAWEGLARPRLAKVPCRGGGSPTLAACHARFHSFRGLTRVPHCRSRFSRKEPFTPLWGAWCLELPTADLAEFPHPSRTSVAHQPRGWG